MKKTVKTLTSILGSIFVAGLGGTLSSCGDDGGKTYYGPPPMSTPEECCARFEGTSYEKYYNRCMELADRDTYLHSRCAQIQSQVEQEIQQEENQQP